MELGLSLGDVPSKASGGLSTVTTTAAVDKSLGFCMALGMNPLSGTCHQIMEKPHSHDDDDDDDDDDDGDEYDDDDGEEHEKYEQILKENGGIREVIGCNQRISSLNPPVQLDLLPSAPVPRHIPWSSDNAMVAEEATSSFRLEFKSYRNLNGESKMNHKRRGFEIGNEVVDVERASDEDDNGMSRKKLRLSKEQSAYLEETFKEHNTLNPKQKLALAEQLNLRPRQVEVWFQNRRARTKLKQTELDYEYLKRCCETLTEENRRLHKELQELRALKTISNPFYMQLPATTFTMCPSCERIATTSDVTLPPPST